MEEEKKNNSHSTLKEFINEQIMKNCNSKDKEFREFSSKLMKESISGNLLNKNVKFYDQNEKNESGIFTNEDQKTSNDKERLWNEIYHVKSKVNEDCIINNNTRINYDKRSWTIEEEKKLFTYAKICNSKNWKKISEIIGTKTPQQCSYRYQRLTNNNKDQKWTRAEEIKLMDLVETKGFDWHSISKELGKSKESIEERYFKKLDPNLNRSKFSQEEDELIIKLHNELGNKWNEIAKSFPDRNASMIKNRFYSYIRKETFRVGNHNISRIDENSINFNVSEDTDKEYPNNIKNQNDDDVGNTTNNVEFSQQFTYPNQIIYNNNHNIEIKQEDNLSALEIHNIHANNLKKHFSSEKKNSFDFEDLAKVKNFNPLPKISDFDVNMFFKNNDNKYSDKNQQIEILENHSKKKCNEFSQNFYNDLFKLKSIDSLGLGPFNEYFNVIYYCIGYLSKFSNSNSSPDIFLIVIEKIIETNIILFKCN